MVKCRFTSCDDNTMAPRPDISFSCNIPIMRDIEWDVERTDSIYVEVGLYWIDFKTRYTMNVFYQNP